MKVTLADFIRGSEAGEEAAAILRRCVHCGFCNAVCPTYQLLGDELDGPRGRIYLIKAALEGQPVSARTQLHLDRCLHCLACVASCPSGVDYGRLVDIGRDVVEARVPRRAWDARVRALLRGVLPRRWLFAPLVSIGKLLRPVLPSVLADKIPLEAAGARHPWPATAPHARRMILLAGCVQPALAPNINAATARLLDRFGILPVEVDKAGCCGALRQHLNDSEGALKEARRNIDAWWPEIARGAEAVLVTASGCGVQVRQYGHLLRSDPAYAEKAERISRLCRDPAEVLVAEALRQLPRLQAAKKARGRLAFHSSCTLQHGLKIQGVVERLLSESGFDLVQVEAPHLCCGSAGTYSVLQPALSQQLRDLKLTSLMAGAPERIATANIGCLTHLQAGSAVPVVHWVELMDEVLQ